MVVAPVPALAPLVVAVAEETGSCPALTELLAATASQHFCAPRFVVVVIVVIIIDVVGVDDGGGGG
jgi:L-cystine uptake protein TcyP (sodium:dicarboxylate symporter family)